MQVDNKVASVLVVRWREPGVIAAAVLGVTLQHLNSMLLTVVL